MSDPWPGIKINEFEYVVTGPSKTLLRVSGHGPRRRETAHRPILVIDDGRRGHRFSPLPSPPDRGRIIRAAYAVPSAIVPEARAFWLEHDSGARINLPVPEAGVARTGSGQREPRAAGEEDRPSDPRLTELDEAHTVALGAAMRRTSEAEARAAEARAQATAAESRERAVVQQLTDATAHIEVLSRRLGEAEQSTQELQAAVASAERELQAAVAVRQRLEAELAEQRSARASLEREFDHARDQLRLMTSERDEFSRQATAFDEIAVKARERAMRAESAQQKASATLQELDVWRGELERRLAATTTELGAARAAHEADERELARLRAALAQTDEQRVDPIAGN